MIRKKFTQVILCVAILVSLLMACTSQETATTIAPEAQAPNQTSKTITPSPTPTLIPPTETQIPPTPTITNTPLPTATPTPADIAANNAGELRYVNRYGNGVILGVDISNDGEKFVVLTSVEVRLYDTETGDLLWMVEPEIHYQQAVFSEDGNTLLVTTKGGTLHHLDSENGVVLSTVLDVQENNIESRFSPFGNYLATYDIDRNLSVFETNTGEPLLNKAPTIEKFSLNNLLMSPDGTKLIVFGYHSPSYKYQTQVWDIASGEIIHNLQFLNIHFFEYLNFKFSNDGESLGFFATREGPKFDKSRLFIWTSDSKELFIDQRFEKQVTAFCFGTNGNELLIGDESGLIQTLDIETMTMISEFPNQNSQITEIIVSSDGNRIISTNLSGEITIWDNQANQVGESIKIDVSKASPSRIYKKTKLGGTDSYPLVIGFALSPNGETMAITAQDTKSINIIDIQSGETIQNLKSELDYHYSNFAFSNDGRIAAARDDYSIAIWDVETGNQILVIPTGIEERIVQLQFSPDGKLLASLSDIQYGSYFGKWDVYSQLFVWNSETGEKYQTFFGYKTFDFSPDGKTIASDNVDFGLYVWGVEDGAQVASDPAEWIFDVKYAPDNKSIAIASMQIREDLYSNINLVYFVDVENEYVRLPLELTDHISRPYLLAFSSDGSILATGDLQGNVYIWEVESGHLIKMIPEVTNLADIIFTPDQRSLLVVGSDGVIRFFAIQ